MSDAYSPTLRQRQNPFVSGTRNLFRVVENCGNLGLSGPCRRAAGLPRRRFSSFPLPQHATRGSRKPPASQGLGKRLAEVSGLFQTKIFVTFEPITSEQATNGQRCSSYRSGPLIPNP